MVDKTKGPLTQKATMESTGICISVIRANKRWKKHWGYTWVQVQNSCVTAIFGACTCGVTWLCIRILPSTCISFIYACECLCLCMSGHLEIHAFVPMPTPVYIHLCVFVQDLLSLSSPCHDHVTHCVCDLDKKTSRQLMVNRSHSPAKSTSTILVIYLNFITVLIIYDPWWMWQEREQVEEKHQCLLHSSLQSLLIQPKVREILQQPHSDVRRPSGSR